MGHMLFPPSLAGSFGAAHTPHNAVLGAAGCGGFHGWGPPFPSRSSRLALPLALQGGKSPGARDKQGRFAWLGVASPEGRAVGASVRLSMGLASALGRSGAEQAEAVVMRTSITQREPLNLLERPERCGARGRRGVRGGVPAAGQQRRSAPPPAARLAIDPPNAYPVGRWLCRPQHHGTEDRRPAPPPPHAARFADAHLAAGLAPAS